MPEILHSTPQPPLESSVAPKLKKFGLTKYTVYVTSRRMYVVGSNTRESMFRILEIDFTSPERLIMMEDNVYFSRAEIMDVLNGLEDSSEGGLIKKVTGVGLLGFIRFTDCYYLLVVTKRRPVAILGGHYLYHIDGTKLIPVTSNPKKPASNSEEARFLHTFLSIDLSKTFYYSYTYDLTNTLQINCMRYKTQSLGLSKADITHNFTYNDRFVWNSHLLEPILSTFDRVYDWFQPIIHGFIDQVKISIFDADVYITLIARRSHYFAGARFFKRGVNDSGNVANEVETEQIVSDMLTSSFHDSAAGFFNNPRYTSFVQHRGSIPLSWSQATAPNIRMTKPPIELNVIDPYYSAAALHFDDMFKRYGAPVQVLNLIKQHEKTPRETKLLTEFENCINYLNNFLPTNQKIEYTAWDMSRASKSHGQDVIVWLEHYSEHTVSATGFFHNGKTLESTQLQQGICRTNCIDCLDRTNAAQFVIGKRALGHQLCALGYVKNKYLEYDSDAVNIWAELFHDHGDTIALQYGGSNLVNTLQTYRKINQWSSHSRDMIESVKRFYSNSFVDAQRQDAINLFLGNYVYKEGHPMLWDLNTDYYLHNNYIDISLNYKPSYTHWYSDCNLLDQKKELMRLQNLYRGPEFTELERITTLKIDSFPGFYDNYWNNKYPPKELSTFNQLFEFNMGSTLNYSKHINSPNTEQEQQQIVPESITMNKTFDNNDSSVISKNDESEMRSIYSRSLISLSQNDWSRKYTSPFKSKKPKREKRLEYRLKQNENVETLSSSNYKSDESFKVCGLRSSYAKYNRVAKSHGYLTQMLEHTNAEINASIKETKVLPIITGPSSQFLNEDAFDYVDEAYLNSGNTSIMEQSTSDEGSFKELTDQLGTRYSAKYPKVSTKDIQVYSRSVNQPADCADINAQKQNLREKYQDLLRPKVSYKDCDMYRQFVDCMTKWKVEKDTVDSVPSECEESNTSTTITTLSDASGSNRLFQSNMLPIKSRGPESEYFSFKPSGDNIEDIPDNEVMTN